ncbi:MAG TPA: acyltransferase [Niabella sp.]|nr:acyltransferase [Niabella sp.]
MDLKSKIKSSTFLKKIALWLLSPKNDPRPRYWIRYFVNPFVHKRGRHARVRRTARMDLFPFNKFFLGSRSIIEAYAVVNNGVGDVTIGQNTIIGIGCVLIGPVTIGDNVMLAQHIVISGLNHGYEDVLIPPKSQPVTTKRICIEDDVWIGANAVITAGVTIGKHAVVGAGSVVTKDVPAFSVVVGNPARVIKEFDTTDKNWKSVKKGAALSPQ